MQKSILRSLVAIASVPFAWVTAPMAAAWTLSPLPTGGYEGTAATIVVVPIAIIAIVALTNIIGVALINHLYQR